MFDLVESYELERFVKLVGLVELIGLVAFLESFINSSS